MEQVNLQDFCCTDPTRPYLVMPFSRGAFTYATDGFIVVRVPRLPEVGGIEIEVNVERVFLSVAEETFFSPPKVVTPTPDAESCGQCDGSGKRHLCPSCRCKCRDCDGTGKTDSARNTCVLVSGHPFALLLWRRICELPGFKISTDRDSSSDPLPFRFDGGGEGAIMGLRSKHVIAIELVP